MTMLTTPSPRQHIQWAIEWIEAGYDPQQCLVHLAAALATLDLPVNPETDMVYVGDFLPDEMPAWAGGHSV